MNKIYFKKNFVTESLNSDTGTYYKILTYGSFAPG